jgi:superfamily II DNA or RNA helicase
MTHPPTRLADLQLSYSYRKGTDDIARDFYLPCHAVASEYDRAVGFFSSSIYALAWPSLKKFVENGGKIRLICSPILSEGDQDALAEGYQNALRDCTLPGADAALKAEIAHLLSNPYARKPTRVLATLVGMGVVDLKVAFLSRNADGRSRTIFHDKVGIFSDTNGDAVAFKGSMNETWSGLSDDGNLESVDVFLSWADSRERERVTDEIAYFNALWSNTYPNVAVREFPSVARAELLDSADPANWEQLVDEIVSAIELAKEISPDKRPGSRRPREHQVLALQAWREHGRRGILEHATGSGKTFTALCAIADSLARGEIPLILVPSALLMEQWASELQSTFGDSPMSLLKCDGTSPDWRRWLGPYSSSRVDESRIILASMSTAATAEFLGRIRQGSHIFLIADEVHALGSAMRQSILRLETGPRLGLSATPHRAGDPAGTSAILNYFGGIIPPPFTLRDAIKAGALCPYFYAPHTVALTAVEQDQWNDLTERIKQIYAATGARSNLDEDSRLKFLILKRARIAKQAVGKIGLAVSVLKNTFRKEHRWIVYCDNKGQLEAVCDALRAEAMPVSEYHSAMRADRDATLRHFEDLGGILVAIKCLDEGVDIPAVDHALVLASSKNPREFVQRRGRVLRPYPGKHAAYIHDAVVVPDAPPGDVVGNRMLAAELCRAITFGRDAANPSSITDIELIALQFEINLGSSALDGVENEDDDE